MTTAVCHNYAHTVVNQRVYCTATVHEVCNLRRYRFVRSPPVMALASLLQSGKPNKAEVPAYVREKYDVEKELARWEWFNCSRVMRNVYVHNTPDCIAESLEWCSAAKTKRARSHVQSRWCWKRIIRGRTWRGKWRYWSALTIRTWWKPVTFLKTVPTLSS